ncbi:hypothetical protein V6N11_029865 [Hibiscus sabdariffa]|uniref:RNase H type-1 domain-containing protein n=1 Tax=Hibiscus sabdariffa TaxID=183260 RepID=A0ABR2PJ54_9ROSI
MVEGFCIVDDEYGARNSGGGRATRAGCGVGWRKTAGRRRAGLACNGSDEFLTIRLSTFFIALWAIWGHRNKLIHENCPNNLNSLLSSILSIAKEVDLVLSPSKVQSTTEESSWSPPPVGAVKANFDAAFNKEANCSFSAVIIRNHDGNMMAACSVFNSFIADPCIAEAKACEQAVKLVKQFDFRKVIFEGDSLTVIKKLCSRSRGLLLISMIVHNIYGLCGGLDFCTFQHVPGLCNKAAHVVAQLGRSLPSSSSWIHHGPPLLEKAIDYDRRGFRSPP